MISVGVSSVSSFSAQPFSVPSMRLIFSLAPTAPPSSVNTPTPGLGFTNVRPSSSVLVSGDKRRASCYYGNDVSRATRHPSSVAARDGASVEAGPGCLSQGATSGGETPQWLLTTIP